LPREHLLNQHVGRLDPDADHPRQQPDHWMVGLVGLLRQPFGARGLDLADLSIDEAQSCHVAAQLGQRVGRQRRPFRHAQLGKPLRRPRPSPGQARANPV
jgi:hypothetical protein